MAHSNRVKVTGLTETVTAATIEPLFLNCGPIDGIAEGDNSTTATITFAAADGACIASMLDGVVLSGVILGVKWESDEAFDHAASEAATAIEISDEPTSTTASLAASKVLGAAKLGASVVVGGAGAVAGGVGHVAGGVATLVKGKEVTGTATTQQWGAGYQPQWGAPPQ